MTFINKRSATSVPITPVTPESLKKWLQKQSKARRSWVAAAGFTGSLGALLTLPGKDGALEQVLYGVRDPSGLYSYADLPARLPKNAGGYYIDQDLETRRATQAALGWALGSYQFARYKTSNRKDLAALVWPAKADRREVEATAAAVTLVRDLVNIPSNDMGPAELAAAAKKVAGRFRKTTFSVIVGKDLVKKNYPAVYAVGQGSPREPRFIDFRWGRAKDPRVTLVGKGVCFDTGGLDIKPSSAMALMKKDMGGAAHVLGLAQMIMTQNLPVQLRVLIPAVENATDGNSFRPGDIINSRKGLTIEIGDTDAEGRLVLADALAEACREKPDLLIDFATLTGAARVALGPDLPAMFSNNDRLAGALLECSAAAEDPVWRLPLWQPYKDGLASKVADTNNIGGGSHAGAITAALFLEKFVAKETPWIHIDTFAWNPSAKPGRPEGGAALGMRAVYELLKKSYTT